MYHQMFLESRRGSDRLGRGADSATAAATLEFLEPDGLRPGPEVCDEGYSIRLPPRAETVSCHGCGRLFRTSGPTGFLGKDPICDGCLLVGESRLGMLLTMVSVCRRYALLIPVDPAEDLMYQRELMAFARVYERYASRFGPPRPWQDFLGVDPGNS